MVRLLLRWTTSGTEKRVTTELTEKILREKMREDANHRDTEITEKSLLGDEDGATRALQRKRIQTVDMLSIEL
jgi:hypothetical protein